MRDSLLLVAAAVLLAASWLWLRRLSLLRRCIRVAGRVESHEERRSGETTLYFPVVSFKDARGRFQYVTGHRGRTRAWPARGATMLVLYPDEEPASAVLCSFLSTWGASAGLALLGGGCLLVRALW